MNWWQRLKKNGLARFGITILLIFYIAIIGADFFSPYNPYDSQVDGSLLPPTTIHWRNTAGEWIGPHVYPTTQGAIDLDTGKRELIVDQDSPSPIRLFAKGHEYKFLGVFPSSRHLIGTAGDGKLNLLGTDSDARDEFSRLLYGGRISLSIGLVGVAISFPLGMLIGGISGYYGGATDSILMRLVEVLMSVPTIYLLVALTSILPPGLTSSQRFLMIVVLTSFVSWSGLARVIRGQVLSLKQRGFVQAAQAMGGNSLYIIIRHILPQTATYIIIAATLSVPSFIGAEAVLSLIGLGIQQPDPSWGNMLSLATNASILILQPWLIWPPAVVIILTVLSFNLLGDALRDALDPQSIQR